MDEPIDDFMWLSSTQKQLLTDSLYNCIEILKSYNLLNEEPSEKWSSTEATTLGLHLSKQIIKISKDLNFIEEEEFFLNEESVEEECFYENQSDGSTTDNSQQSFISK